MTKAEAIQILDPETSREALAPYRLDCELMQAKAEEACRVAVEAMRELEAVKKCKWRCAVCRPSELHASH